MKRARLDAPDIASSGESAGHQPKISRKIRACQACQNRKIKCNILPGQSRCERCAHLDLQCVVNKSLQTLLESDNEWKTRVELQLQTLQAAVIDVQRLLNVPPLIPLQTSALEGECGLQQQSPGLVAPAVSSSSLNNGLSPVRPADVTAMTRENSPDSTSHDGQDQAIVNAPMASLFEVTKLRNIRSSHRTVESPRSSGDQETDFIAQGKLSLKEAERLFSTFRVTLNAYLWGGIALVHDTLAATRASSALLTAAILAVTALHAKDEGRTFDICYPIFLELTSQSVFARRHTLDDVRGLCIGAFWLSDVSWKLSGLAVRIATELNLHQFCTTKPPRNAPAEHIEKARLWYLLYVCDHHFSIAYGRPPVINGSANITSHESFLQLPGITQSDFRLHSQVGIFIILSRVVQTFGLDRSRLVANDEFEALRRYDVDLGYWRDHWETRLDPDQHISQYPAQGVLLHYHFARLQLFSICLRGLKPSGQYTISSERQDFVNMAIGSASAAIGIVLDDADIRESVVGVPLYLLTTIAYACLFLMKVQSQWKLAGFDLRYDEVVSLMERTVALLDKSRQCVRHVAHYIGRGLNNMLERLKEQEAQDRQQSRSNQLVPEEAWAEPGLWQSQDWNDWMFGGETTDHSSFSMLGVLNSQMPI